jgi:hypothetical protein
MIVGEEVPFAVYVCEVIRINYPGLGFFCPGLR